MGVLASLFKGHSILPFKDSVAQLVEHHTFNVGVMGSNPIGVTNLSLALVEWSIT